MRSEELYDFTVTKSDNDKHLVFGWANIAETAAGTPVADSQGDMIDYEELEKAAYEHVLQFRATGEEHMRDRRGKGQLVESCVFTPEKQRAIGIPDGRVPVGWWVGYKITDEDTWARIKSGQYSMFSIEGKGKRIAVGKSKRPAPTFFEIIREDMAKGVTPGNWVCAKRRPAPTFFEILRRDMANGITPENWNARVEIKKYNPYHGKDGRFTTAPGGRKKHSFKRTRTAASKTKKVPGFEHEELALDNKEYGKIRHEINTNYGRHRGKAISHHALSTDNGYCEYYFENHGYDDYVIYDKKERK